MKAIKNVATSIMYPQSIIETVPWDRSCINSGKEDHLKKLKKKGWSSLEGLILNL